MTRACVSRIRIWPPMRDDRSALPIGQNVRGNLIGQNCEGRSIDVTRVRGGTSDSSATNPYYWF